MKEKTEHKEKWKHVHSGGSGAVYGMGVLGALVYFIQHASSFQDGAIGVIQSIFWPAVLIYKALELLNL